jgi:hypothetical protein
VIIVFENNKEIIEDSIKMIEQMKTIQDKGRINNVGRVKVNLAKNVKIENMLDVDPETEVVVIDFAVWNPDPLAINDSPRSRPTTIEEHNENCDKLIKELKSLRDAL